jgi:palmitoyltransferase
MGYSSIELPVISGMCFVNSCELGLPIPICFYLYLQVVILGMTTNERLNASRYKHFHRTPKKSSWLKKTKYASPFDRGILHNAAEFFHIRIGGGSSSSGSPYQRPRDVDWKAEFNMDRWLNDDEEELIPKNNVNNV